MFGCALRAIGIGLLAVALGCNQAAPQPQARPPVPVVVERAASTQVPLEIDVIGNVVSMSTIEVRSRIDGQIERVFFREGQEVHKGDPLFQIDARPYKVALERATADLARDQAQLRHAELEEKRYAALLSQKLVSAQEYDQRSVTLESLRATVQSDHSAVDDAKLNLYYTKITAPISGRTGGLQITAGNLVKANADLPLVVLRQLSPMYVAFAVPADRLPEIRRSAGASQLPVEAIAHGDSAAAPAQGQLSFIDNSIDAATGTIALKATFLNDGAELWPGQFVDVKLRLSSLPNAIVIPARAIQTGQRGDQVFVVKDDLTVDARAIKTGVRKGDLIVVKGGVAAGERVVVDGQLNLVPGSKVAIKANGGAPSPAEHAEGERP